MPLQFDMLQSAVRITTFGDLLGTGFLVRVPSEADQHYAYTYIVTAHHVIRNHVGIEVEVPSPFDNGPLYPPVTVADWDPPLPDVDLAIARYLDADERNHQAVWLGSIWPGVPDLGHHVYYVGIFQPVDRPMARSGTIGALEYDGIPHSNGRYTFPAHLVDCRSYQGFSGSPCFMEMAFTDLSGKDIPAWVPRGHLPVGRLNYYTILCGMFTGHYDDDDPEVVSKYGVGVMLPGRFIVEALMSEKHRQKRREWDQERAVENARSGPGLRDAGAQSSPSDEFAAFEDLSRKLVHVPKKELDEKLKREREG